MCAKLTYFVGVFELECTLELRKIMRMLFLIIEVAMKKNVQNLVNNKKFNEKMNKDIILKVHFFILILGIII